MKINTNGAFDEQDQADLLGMLVKDSNGLVVEVCAHLSVGCDVCKYGGYLCNYCGLQHVLDRCFDGVVIETYAYCLIIKL